ncbi:hypothetical protein [Fretibacter rubidus]|uniref:hypothetical protein n=1 Tax=Fretibacter rubidus TaxID=570162 RepID=UPI00352A4443
MKKAVLCLTTAALLSAIGLSACQQAVAPTQDNNAPQFRPISAAALPAIVTGNDDYLPDFSYAGYKNGNVPLPEVSGTVFDVTDYGAVPGDGLDDTQALFKAQAAANAHDGPVVVKFPVGRFILSDIFYITRSDFALQGTDMGEDKTTLYYPFPLTTLPTPAGFKELDEYLIEFDKRQREKKNNVDMPFSLYAWSGGFIWTGPEGHRAKAYLERYDNFPDPITAVTAGTKDDLSIEVADGSSVSVGDVLKIEWYNREGENGSILSAMYGDRTKFKKLGSHHWNFPRRPLITQFTKITAKDGNRLTLADPLLMDARPEWEPALVPWDQLQHISISDLDIEFPNGIRMPHHVEDGFNALYLTGIYDSFVRNVTVTNADAGIISDDSANMTITDFTTTGDHRAHYTVHMGAVYNVLAEKLRVENVAEHPLSFNTYSVKSVYKNSDVLAAPLLDQHSGANHQNLFDDIRVHVTLPDDVDDYALFDGGGAGYWKPSHGRFSTFYNINVDVTGGAAGPITLSGPQDGVQARILGVHGNREFDIRYTPDPIIEQLNQAPTVRSLYDYQMQQRRQ